MTHEKGCYGRALSPMGADKLPTEIIPFPLRTLKKASLALALGSSEPSSVQTPSPCGRVF